MEKDSVLEMRHIYKTFPGVKALQNVDFTLKKGEIHALMGENGAGKSTLIKVLTGVEEFETGEIMIDGCDHAIINRIFFSVNNHKGLVRQKLPRSTLTVLTVSVIFQYKLYQQ